MYSLSIHFGPNAVVWAFLFKDKERAQQAYRNINSAIDKGRMVLIEDDFGQIGTVGSVTGYLLEDLELTDEAKILRSLANARCEVKARQRAATDSVIRSGMQNQGPSVLQPRFNG